MSEKKIDADANSPDPDYAESLRAFNALETNPENALAELQLRAAKGSASSMFYLGYAYRKGVGTSTDWSEAERWYRQAADKGLLHASYSLGRLYLDQKRFADAKEIFEFAASEDFAPAIHFLGRIYFYGLGVDKDVGKGRELLERATMRGCVFAKAALAYDLMYNGKSLHDIVRGILMRCSCYIDVFAIVLTDGFSSDRLR